MSDPLHAYSAYNHAPILRLSVHSLTHTHAGSRMHNTHTYSILRNYIPCLYVFGLPSLRVNLGQWSADLINSPNKGAPWNKKNPTGQWAMDIAIIITQNLI